MDPEAIKEGRSRRRRERAQQAKERGLCTTCRRETAKPNKARCEQCCRKTREYRARKEQIPNGPTVPGGKPTTLPWSKERPEEVAFPFYHQPDRLTVVRPGSWAREENPNKPTVPESKPITLRQRKEPSEQIALPFEDQPDGPEPDDGSSARRSQE